MPTKKWEFKAAQKSKEQKEQINPNFKDILKEASTKPIEEEDKETIPPKTFFEKLAEWGLNLEGVKSVEKPGQKVTLK